MVDGGSRVGADVPGGPRPRGRFHVRGAPRTSRPTIDSHTQKHDANSFMVDGGSRVVGADVLGGPPAFPMMFSCARRAEDVAPYQWRNAH